MNGRCSETARRRGDPCFASAPPAQQWLLLEHPGPWGRHILTDAGLDRDVARALGGWAQQAGSRVLLIRRPGSRQPQRARHWCWADARPGREQLRWGTYTDDGDVLGVLRTPEALGQPSAEPVYLVCAHGKHDVCCAMRGRPVAAALAAPYPGRTWECSHVGGDRFAANLVLLPYGLYYGQVSPTDATEIVEAHEHGRLVLPWLRGHSSLPAPVQAAQHFVRSATGETGIACYPSLSCEPTGPDEWTVRLAGSDGRPVTVVVRARMHDTDEPLTCAATGPGQFRVFELADGACGRPRPDEPLPVAPNSADQNCRSGSVTRMPGPTRWPG